MKTKVSVCSFFIVILMLLALPPSAFSHPPDRQYLGEGKKQEIMKKLFDQLNLTPEQKQKLEENRNKYKEEAKILRKEIHDKKELLKEELAKSELDMSKITQIHNELKAVLLKMEDHLLERILEARKILTPEQIDKLHKKMEKFRKQNQEFRKYRR
ncbi:MAG: periplasmic heavy metal sensor [Pseudomonadota bacterium]